MQNTQDMRFAPRRSKVSVAVDQVHLVYSAENMNIIHSIKSNIFLKWWLGSRVVSMLDSGAEGPGFKYQSRRCRVTVIGKLFTPIVPLFTKQQNW